MTQSEHNSEATREDVPDTIGRYELLTKFATGGMAELFLARERGVGGLERVVVIKRLLPHLADDSSSVEMFLREARLVARLNHPNVVQTYELGEEEGEYFLAMEYLHGSTLRELQTVAEEHYDRIPLEIAVSAIDQSSRGLHAAHELRDFEGELVGLIHRDVSPQNLMLTEEGYVKLLDFGVAKAVEGKEATYSGNIKGKFSYMSPEQLHRRQLDRRSDIFALGIVTWELMVGERLFDRDGELETMQAITEEEAPPPSSQNPAIPEALDPVVLRALEKDRRERYTSAEEFRQDLIEVGEEHDLLTDENELAQFVREVAGDQLDARHETLQEALERSLTADERAQLRHEEGGIHASPTPSGTGGEATSVERPSADRPREESGSSPTGPSTPPQLDADATAQLAKATERTTAPLDGDEQGGGADDDTAVRWQIGLSVAAVLLLAASGIIAFWGGTAESSGEAGAPNSGVQPILGGEPLTFGLVPIASEEVLRPEFNPIEEYLEAEVGRPINVTVASSYEEVSEKLRDGEFDAAMLTPLLFVRTRRADPDVKPLALREFDGSVRSNGLLLVRSGADIDELADLRGMTFCFTDRNSTTGNFLPRVFIRRSGFEPQDFIGRVHWSGNHLRVLKDLVDGKCEAAATYSGSYLTADEHHVQVGKFRQLAVTGYSPSDTITGRPGLPETLTREMQAALLRFDPNEHAGVSAVGTTLQVTGFREPKEKYYRGLEKAVDEHRDILDRFDFPGISIDDTAESASDAGGDAGEGGDAGADADGGAE